MLHQRGYAKMFMIFKEDELIGVISFNRIEPLNKTAEIGYWLDESHQGQGIISQALQALIHHYAQSGELRRFVIKCRVDNPQSNQVALRNGFILEGCLKQAEFLNDAYDDVNLYARILDSQSPCQRRSRNALLAVNDFWTTDMNRVAIKGFNDGVVG